MKKKKADYSCAANGHCFASVDVTPRSNSAFHAYGNQIGGIAPSILPVFKLYCQMCGEVRPL
jgi:hypothetical protein